MTDRRPVALIVNPTAGGGRALRLLPRLLAVLHTADERGHVHVTAAPGEATAAAVSFAARGFRLVVAVGGDGTVNEVANGLLAADPASAPALGALAAGRGADFVRGFAATPEPGAALARLLRAEPRRIDVGRAELDDGTVRHFVNVAGVGLDAAAADRGARSPLPGSTLPYLHGLAGALLRHRPRAVTITADGQPIAARVTAVVVANGRFFGGGIEIVPGAAVDDGRLDLAVVGDLSRLGLLRQLPRAYRGTHPDHPAFTHRLVRSVRIDATALLPVQLDGEVVGFTPVDFAVMPGVLRFVG